VAFLCISTLRIVFCFSTFANKYVILYFMHKTKVTVFLASLVVTLVLPYATHAATYTVTKTADTADGTCDSDCSLREAVIAANTGSADTIIIPAGTYPFTRTAAGEEAASTGDLDFTDTDLTTITGAGSGLGGGATIIDPDDNDRGIDVKSGAAVSITALTVNDGNVSSAAGMGAGILNQGSLTLNDVYVTGNTLTTAGSSDGYGVGIMCSGTELNITNSVISNNIGTSASGNVVGGGLDIASTCSATLSTVTISGNQAMKGGGVAAFTASNAVSFTDVTISNNIAGDVGGGVFVQGDDVATPVNIHRALFQDNDANYTGGGVFATAPLNIVNASFYGNHAGDAGGAFGTDSSTSPRINLVFVTMTRNTADGAAPGLYVGGATPDTHIKNSIIASNNHTADISDVEDCTGTPISDDYNYIAASLSCDVVPQSHDIVNTEAGSVYFTATPIDDGGNVFVTALWETGVTLDMIPSDSCTDGNGDPVTDDASGRSRPQNARCDLGAHEKADTVTLTPTLTSPTSSSSQRVLNLQ
jgi:CSLREA domain-containing protein